MITAWERLSTGYWLLEGMCTRMSHLFSSSWLRPRSSLPKSRAIFPSWSLVFSASSLGVRYAKVVLRPVGDDPRGSHHQGAIAQGLREILGDHGVVQYVPCVLRPLVGLVGERAGIHQDEVVEVEVAQSPRHCTDVAIVLRIDQYDLESSHGPRKN